jgi:phosphatidylserine/phosphatidylglycerophosphate/cardiolipin synthase-like enzyme
MQKGKEAIILIVILLSLPGITNGLNSERVLTFVSPDSSRSGFTHILDSTDSFLYLSFYTIKSTWAKNELIELLGEGVNVTIIVDEMPAGGFPSEEANLLSELAVRGAKIYLAGDEFRFYHGKYVVSDNETILMTTENLGETGFPREGNAGNRGWGVIIEDADTASYFSNVFQVDLEHSRLFQPIRQQASPTTSSKSFSPLFILKDYTGYFEITSLVAPKDSIEKITGLLDSANESLYIQQFYVYKYWGKRKTGSVEKTPNPFLEQSISAARRGVKVRLLLDDTWYNIEEDDPVSNLNTVLYVNEIARKEGLDLEAKLVDSDDLGLEKIHTKGLVVDEKLVLISSVNWNENSPKNNREVGVIVAGAPAKYFVEVFENDWGEKKQSVANTEYILFLILLSAGLIYRKRRRR